MTTKKTIELVKKGFANGVASDEPLSDNEKQNIGYELVSKYPTLIKRPVLIQNGDVMVGFSEKKYLELLL